MRQNALENVKSSTHQWHLACVQPLRKPCNSELYTNLVSTLCNTSEARQWLMVKFRVRLCLCVNRGATFIHFCSHLNLRLSSIVVCLQYMVKEVIIQRVIWYAAQSMVNFILVLIIFLRLRQVWPMGINEFVQYCKYCFLNYKTKLRKKVI